jgi:hypothetical protein
MLANLAAGSIMVAIFSGICSYDAIQTVRRFTLPLAYLALAAAIVFKGMTYVF